jgi:hypothetical protein
MGQSWISMGVSVGITMLAILQTVVRSGDR